ncbi:protease complex subunit PrcB family protein [Salegentibacter sp.]|uniref:protease complex subunit PrcB family protein n=1 Tax=Salegentibacter sp. TaxID=1903072 RepID=UPI0035677AFE
MKSVEKSLSKSFLIILSFLIFTSCSEDDIPDGDEIQFESIAQHYLSTGEELREQQLVIRDRESWEELLTQMESINDQAQYFSRKEFNFSEEILLVVLDKFRANGGHSIEIPKILESDTQVNAIVKKPENGNPTTMVMQPYHIVSIDKTSKDIRFILKY